MPRHTHNQRSRRRQSTAPERGKEGSGRRANAPGGDGQILALREAGSSYSEIARRLGLARAADAHRGYLRAVRTHDGAERKRLVENEEARLDRLERRIRERDADQPDKIDRRLLGVAELRKAIQQ